MSWFIQSKGGQQDVRDAVNACLTKSKHPEFAKVIDDLFSTIPASAADHYEVVTRGHINAGGNIEIEFGLRTVEAAEMTEDEQAEAALEATGLGDPPGTPAGEFDNGIDYDDVDGTDIPDEQPDAAAVEIQPNPDDTPPSGTVDNPEIPGTQ